MGWDIVTCGDRHEMLNDLQLWALRHFLADAAGTLVSEEPPPVPFQEAREFFTNWDWPGPRVVTDTTLDEFVRGSPDRARVLIRVCDRAADKLRAFGRVVPLAYLANHVNIDSPGGVYLSEQPSDLFIRSIAFIRRLLVPDTAPKT